MGRDRYGTLVLVFVVVVVIGCAQGRWVKPDADSNQTQQDFAECDTMSSLQRLPATLGEKRGANPDLSSLEIQKCMKSKGYQWIRNDAQPQQRELLEIVPLQEPQ